VKRVIFVLVALLLFPTVIHAQESGARSGVRVVMENSDATHSQLNALLDLFALPDWQPVEGQEPRYELVITPNVERLPVCQYTIGQIARIRIHVDLTLTDLASGQVVASRRFTAPQMDECPAVRQTILSSVWYSTPVLTDVVAWTREIAPMLDGVLPLRLVANILAHDRGIDQVVFSHDGSRLASISYMDNTIRLWAVGSGANLLTIPYSAEKTTHADGVHFSLDDRYVLMTYTQSSEIYVWDAQTGDLVTVFEGGTSSVSTIDFLPDGEMVLTVNHNPKFKFGGLDSAARLWNMTTGDEIRTFDHGTEGVIGAYFSADDTQVITVGQHSVRVWDAQSGDQLRDIETEFLNRAPVLLTPDKTQVIAAADGGSIQAIDLASGEVIRELTGTQPWTGDKVMVFTDMAISPDGRTLAAGWWGQAYVWDLQSGDLLYESGKISLRSVYVDISPDSRYVLMVGTEAAQIWDLKSAEMVINLVGVGGQLDTGEFSPDGRLVVAARGQRIQLWNVSDLYE
jgi:WD40 repeat protein